MPSQSSAAAATGRSRQHGLIVGRASAGGPTAPAFRSPARKRWQQRRPGPAALTWIEAALGRVTSLTQGTREGNVYGCFWKPTNNHLKKDVPTPSGPQNRIGHGWCQGLVLDLFYRYLLICFICSLLYLAINASDVNLQPNSHIAHLLQVMTPNKLPMK